MIIKVIVFYAIKNRNNFELCSNFVMGTISSFLNDANDLHEGPTFLQTRPAYDYDNDKFGD